MIEVCFLSEIKDRQFSVSREKKYDTMKRLLEQTIKGYSQKRMAQTGLVLGK